MQNALSKDDSLDIEKAIRYVSEKLPSSRNLIKPTLLHSIRVGTYLMNEGYSKDIICAGILHDVLEDGDNVSRLDIENNFGAVIADIVTANSVDGELPREKQTKDLYSRCAAYGTDALIVKAADILDNIQYYKMLDDRAGMDYCIVNTQMFFKYKQDDQNNKIFEDLRSLAETL